MTRPALRITATVLLCCALAAACGERHDREVLRGATMGTSWSIVYEDRGQFSAEAIHALVSEELRAINDVFSTYIPGSEISRLNARSNREPGGVDEVLSERFAAVLDVALELGELTGGAYDVTVGPLVDLWGFGPSTVSGEVPDAQLIAAATQRVGANRLDWNANTRRLGMPAGYRIDLSSLAKGYAVDRLSGLMDDLGLSNTLVEIGGELRARGQRPEGGPWRVAIESPEAAAGRVLGALEIAEDAAVATSGDYRNYFEVGDKRYSHLVDPRSGYPVDHDLVSVTVVHGNCMLADAWATALIVLGREKALAIADAQSLAVYLVSRSADGLEVHYTESFEQYRRADTRGDGR